MVGINTIKMSSDYSNVEGLGFAIPSASIRRLVNDLLTYGEVRPEPSFGVTVLQTGTRLEDDIWGLQVLEVTPGSAADLAGIREGDFVLAAGGRPVETSQELLRIRRQLYVKVVGHMRYLLNLYMCFSVSQSRVRCKRTGGEGFFSQNFQYP